MDTQQLITQLGMAGIFAAALAAVSIRYWQHYEAEITYLRGKIDTLESELIRVKQQLIDDHLKTQK